jgi:hypothetical protein
MHLDKRKWCSAVVQWLADMKVSYDVHHTEVKEDVNSIAVKKTFCRKLILHHLFSVAKAMLHTTAILIEMQQDLSGT